MEPNSIIYITWSKHPYLLQVLDWENNHCDVKYSSMYSTSAWLKDSSVKICAMNGQINEKCINN